MWFGLNASRHQACVRVPGNICDRSRGRAHAFRTRVALRAFSTSVSTRALKNARLPTCPTADDPFIRVLGRMCGRARRACVGQIQILVILGTESLSYAHTHAHVPGALTAIYYIAFKKLMSSEEDTYFETQQRKRAICFPNLA